MEHNCFVSWGQNLTTLWSLGRVNWFSVEENVHVYVVQIRKGLL